MRKAERVGRNIAAVLVSSLGLALAGCGGTDGTASAATSVSSTATAAETAPAASTTTTDSGSTSTTGTTATNTGSGTDTTSGSSTTATTGTTGSAGTTSGTSATPPTTSAATSSVTLGWQAPTQNTNGSPITDLAGYKIHYGTASANYSQTVALNNPGLVSYVVDNLPSGTYYFAITAYNSQGIESALSGEVSKTVN